MTGRVIIEAVTPAVDGGRYPAKAVVDERIHVEATVWREGDWPLSVCVRWHGPADDGSGELVPMAQTGKGTDRWYAELVPHRVGRWRFQVVAWTDRRDGGGIPRRTFVTTGPWYDVCVDPVLARFSSWYQCFPRSTGGWDADGRPIHGTLRTAAADLPRIAAMGFDVVYLAPFHPIGVTGRKGRNGAPTAGPDDPGCPWAVGSADGGHDAVDPRLGTVDDLVAYVSAARSIGVAVAMDLALQCSPDHPWVSEHPEWFRDGGTAQSGGHGPWTDVYPLDFDADPRELYSELLRVVLFWVDRGIRVFRVDNPHTKPMDFWVWLIRTVKQRHPDVTFLAEAFTRSAVQRGLSKLGFSQSLTYFIWRTTKAELTRFGEELVDTAWYLRPNLFPSTHDVLHEILQSGEPAVFAIRAALAATLSPSWGVYSGYELFEHEALQAGSREYRDSEKFELRPRDFSAARSAGCDLAAWLTTLNAIRRAHPALQQLRTLRFHAVDNDELLAYSKTDPVTGDAVLCVVNLNPRTVQRGTVRLAGIPGLSDAPCRTVVDELSGAQRPWANDQEVTLDPAHAVALIVSTRIAVPEDALPH
ncbi:MAG TPA: maltotransferase domain-containing protein [Rugosimonospora sp.]|nr:maltotransferase domain-containing protein [Rugosimonospora sp.]